MSNQTDVLVKKSKRIASDSSKHRHTCVHTGLCFTVIFEICGAAQCKPCAELCVSHFKQSKLTSSTAPSVITRQPQKLRLTATHQLSFKTMMNTHDDSAVAVSFVSRVMAMPFPAISLSETSPLGMAVEAMVSIVPVLSHAATPLPVPEPPLLSLLMKAKQEKIST